MVPTSQSEFRDCRIHGLWGASDGSFPGTGGGNPSPEHTTQIKVNLTVTVAIVVVTAFGVGERRPEKQGRTQDGNKIGSPHSL